MYFASASRQLSSPLRDIPARGPEMANTHASDGAKVDGASWQPVYDVYDCVCADEDTDDNGNCGYYHRRSDRTPNSLPIPRRARTLKSNRTQRDQ